MNSIYSLLHPQVFDPAAAKELCLMSPCRFSIQIQIIQSICFIYSLQVFDPCRSQEAVFEETRHLVQSALDGYNVCIFAYGQVRCSS